MKDGPYLSLEFGGSNSAGDFCRFRFPFTEQNLAFFGFVRTQYSKFKEQEAAARDPKTVFQGTNLVRSRIWEVRLGEEESSNLRLSKHGLLCALLVTKLFKTHPEHYQYALMLQKACTALDQRRKNLELAKRKAAASGGEEESKGAITEAALKENEDVLLPKIVNWLVMIEALGSRDCFSRFYAAVKFLEFEPPQTLLGFVERRFGKS